MVDTVLTSVSSLLLRSRGVLLDELRKGKLQFRGDPVTLPKKFKFCHISLDDLPAGRLREKVYAITTEFRISGTQVKTLRRSADALTSEVNAACLRDIRDLVRDSRRRAQEAANFAINAAPVAVPDSSDPDDPTACTIPAIASGWTWPNSNQPRPAKELSDLKELINLMSKSHKNHSTARIGKLCKTIDRDQRGICAAAKKREEDELLTAEEERLLHNVDLLIARANAHSGRLEDAAAGYWEWWDRDQEHSAAVLNEVAFVQMMAAASNVPPGARQLYERSVASLQQEEKGLRQIIPASEGSRMMTNNLAAARFCLANERIRHPDDATDPGTALRTTVRYYRLAAGGFADLLNSYSQRDGSSDSIALLHDLVGKSAPDDAIKLLDEAEDGVLCGGERSAVCKSLRTALGAWSAALQREQNRNASGEGLNDG